jgi:hypothetical protein
MARNLIHEAIAGKRMQTIPARAGPT